ncbi:hypothetical protein ATCC90586_005411 [Pythium insidiosum]|nr:hypothetical protein ATCC90586_005411 [Pythium insidiosum]
MADVVHELDSSTDDGDGDGGRRSPLLRATPFEDAVRDALATVSGLSATRAAAVGPPASKTARQRETSSRERRAPAVCRKSSPACLSTRPVAEQDRSQRRAPGGRLVCRKSRILLAPAPSWGNQASQRGRRVDDSLLSTSEDEEADKEDDEEEEKERSKRLRRAEWAQRRHEDAKLTARHASARRPISSSATRPPRALSGTSWRGPSADEAGEPEPAQAPLVSLVWRFFDRDAAGNSICSLCGRVMAGHHTSSLRGHLRSAGRTDPAHEHASVYCDSKRRSLGLKAASTEDTRAVAPRRDGKSGRRLSSRARNRMGTSAGADAALSTKRPRYDEGDSDSSVWSRCRPPRRQEPLFSADAVPLEEIQAQEAELARLRAERALARSVAVASIADEVLASKGAVDLCSSSDEDGVTTSGVGDSTSSFRLQPSAIDRAEASSPLEADRTYKYLSVHKLQVNELQDNRLQGDNDAVAMPRRKASARVSFNSARLGADVTAVPTNVLSCISAGKPFTSLAEPPLTDFVHDDPIMKLLPGAAADSATASSGDSTRTTALVGVDETRQRPCLALDDDVSETLLRLVINEVGTSPAVFEALEAVADFAQPQTDYVALLARQRARGKTARRMADAKWLVEGSRGSSSIDARPKRALQQLLNGQPWTKPVDERSLLERLAPDPLIFDSQLVRAELGVRSDRGSLRARDIQPVDTYPELMASYRRHFCPSGVHGWGLFAAEQIRRGDLICEYTGELISQYEAERRGTVYDRRQMSYLFDLNEDAVVDAIRAGNKSRFINHVPSQRANCEGRVVQIRGDHRIGIWAKRDIRRGEELFFDYGYHNSTAPHWSRPQMTLDISDIPARKEL